MVRRRARGCDCKQLTHTAACGSRACVGGSMRVHRTAAAAEHTHHGRSRRRAGYSRIRCSSPPTPPTQTSPRWRPGYSVSWPCTVAAHASTHGTVVRRRDNGRQADQWPVGADG
eukprot:6628670-Prymnesium_polylepis.1